VEGVRELRTGLGEMVKVSVEGPAPVPLLTPTCTAPAVVRNPDGTTAMSWVALTKVVASVLGAEPPQALHHVTTETLLPRNPVPFTVRVTELAVPAVALVGEMEVTAGGLIVSGAVAEGT